MTSQKVINLVGLETTPDTITSHAGHIYLNPKSGDGTLPVGFPGRMGGIGSLFEPPGGRRRQKRPRERPDRRPIKTNRGFREGSRGITRPSD